MPSSEWADRWALRCLVLAATCLLGALLWTPMAAGAIVFGAIGVVLMLGSDTPMCWP